MTMQLLRSSTRRIQDAIKQQLPEGWEQCDGVWWPLELSCGSFMLNGNTLMEYSAFQQYAMARIKP